MESNSVSFRAMPSNAFVKISRSDSSPVRRWEYFAESFLSKVLTSALFCCIVRMASKRAPPNGIFIVWNMVPWVPRAAVRCSSAWNHSRVFFCPDSDIGLFFLIGAVPLVASGVLTRACSLVAVARLLFFPQTLFVQILAPLSHAAGNNAMPVQIRHLSSLLQNTPLRPAAARPEKCP